MTSPQLMRYEGKDRDKLYGRAWRTARAGHLQQHPLCIMCQRIGKLVRADVVDHIQAHRGNHTLFWSPSNWQSLCSPHHNGTKQHEEKTDIKYSGVDVEGRPTHPGHAWNKT